MRQEEVFEGGLGNMLETAVWVYAVCLLGAALLVSAPSHAAEVTEAPHVERLNRVFIGVPNQLTLPPGSLAPADSPDAGGREQPPHIDSADRFDGPKNHSEKDGGAVETALHATTREVQTQTEPAPVVNAEHIHPF